MNLDDELRAVLAMRAEEGQPPVPDIEALRAGGLARRRRRRVAAVLPGMMVLAALAVALAWGQSRPDGHGLGPGPTHQPATSFVGRWMSTDVDASHQTMSIQANSAGRFVMVLHDDFTGPCSGPSTDSGAGSMVDGRLVISGITTDCANGRTPVGAGGSLTFIHRAWDDTLIDNVGVVWSRE
jgi:hypothetical protein